MICPRCKKEYDRLLALSRKDNETMICDRCGVEEALETFGNFWKRRRDTPYERTKAQVHATGNKWAIENFEATHS